MTGRIPSAHGVHDWIRDGNMPPNPAQYLDGLTCYTDVLAENDYTVGLSGKWHLGDSLTPQHGFSHWFALLTGGSKYNDADMIRDGQVEMQPGYLTDVITDDALNFISANKARDPSTSVSTITHRIRLLQDTRKTLLTLMTIAPSKRVRKRRCTPGQCKEPLFTWGIANP